MKRKIINGILASFALFFAACAGGASGAGTGSAAESRLPLMSLMDAIERTAEKTAGELPKGGRVVIVAFESAHDGLSEYVMEELRGALVGRGIEVADRQNLEYVFRELNIQASGEVSEEDAKSVSKYLGADMALTGQLLDTGNAYRFSASAVRVDEDASASLTRLNVRDDDAMRLLLSTLASQQAEAKAAKYMVSENVAPQTAGTFLDRGILFAGKGDDEKAIEDFNESLRIKPGYAAAYYNRGIVYYNKRDYDKAISDYDQVIRLDYNFPYVYSNRGRAHLDKKDYDRAIADYTRVIELYPDDAYAFSNRGSAYRNKGDYEMAIADYSQTIRLDPNYVSAYINRGISYYANNEHDRAIEDYTQTIRLDPNYTNAYVVRGLAYFVKRDYNRAIADYEAALRITPNHSGAKMMLEEAKKRRTAKN
jgi:tetratricopeptide (TPR) repeat protein